MIIKEKRVEGIVQWVKPWLRYAKYDYWAAVKVTSLGKRMVCCYVYFENDDSLPVSGDSVELYRDKNRWKIGSKTDAAIS